MPNLVTIWAFSYQHQMLIIRGRLEAEGIQTFAQDELTIQIDPLYSNALGGIKLMVNEQDVPRAIEILAESGLVKREELQTEEFLTRLDNYTRQLPLIGKASFERRLFVLVSLAVTLIAALIYVTAI